LTNRRIAPDAIVALKRALTTVYWYKNDLRSFLTTSLRNPHLLSRINWAETKRDIVGVLVDEMEWNQQRYGDDLVNLMFDVAKVDDFVHLARLEDGAAKAKEARAAVAALRKHLEGHEEIVLDRRKSEERKTAANERAKRNTDVQAKLAELRDQYLSLLAANHQDRGYILEKILRELFDLFDLDPRASFKVIGEQIDGGFTFDSTDYLFEGKWHADPIGAAALDSLDGKLNRKLDNALGLFLSINGFSRDGITAYTSSGRKLLLLMDGADLMAILEDRIKLPDLLLRKRRHASQTGNVFFSVADILAGRP
jgi:hypothetical protein